MRLVATILIVLPALVVALVGSPRPALAEPDSQVQGELRDAAPKGFLDDVWSRDTLTGNPWELRTDLHDRGVDPQLRLTQYAQWNASGAIEKAVSDADFGLAPVAAPAPVPVESEDLWGFRVAVPMYVWWPSLSGNAKVSGEKLDYHLNHADVLDLIFSDINGIYFFFGEVRRGRVAAQLDLIYMGLDHVSIQDIDLSLEDGTVFNGLPRDPTGGLDQYYGITLLDPSLSYQIFEQEDGFGPFDSFEFSLAAGFRYLFFQAKVKTSDLRIESLNHKTVLKNTENFWEIFPVGATFRLGFNENWGLRGRLLLGGWGMATAKKGTDGLADLALTYQFHDHFSFEFGMRWLDANVKGEDIDYQLRNAWGPVFGIIANF